MQHDALKHKETNNFTIYLNWHICVTLDFHVLQLNQNKIIFFFFLTKMHIGFEHCAQTFYMIQLKKKRQKLITVCKHSVQLPGLNLRLDEQQRHSIMGAERSLVTVFLRRT